jgi:hypothetical protein
MTMIGMLALLMLASAAAPVQADVTRPQLLVIVRQETRPPLTDDMLRKIATEATAIWRPYLDIAFQFADCLAPFGGDDRLELLLTDRQSNGRPAAGLGWIDFVDGEPSRTITASVGTAKTLAEQGKWAGRPVAAWPPAVRQLVVVRALARGVAHEIGHYLLRSQVHAVRGLMRARFTVDEIMANDLGVYRLQETEVAMLKERATSYALSRQRRDRRVLPEHFPANSACSAVIVVAHR